MPVQHVPGGQPREGRRGQPLRQSDGRISRQVGQLRRRGEQRHAKVRRDVQHGLDPVAVGARGLEPAATREADERDCAFDRGAGRLQRRDRLAQGGPGTQRIVDHDHRPVRIERALHLPAGQIGLALLARWPDPSTVPRPAPHMPTPAASPSSRARRSGWTRRCRACPAGSGRPASGRRQWSSPPSCRTSRARWNHCDGAPAAPEWTGGSLCRVVVSPTQPGDRGPREGAVSALADLSAGPRPTCALMVFSAAVNSDTCASSASSRTR